MQKVTLISSESDESKAVIRLLREKQIPYREYLECSLTAPPMLLDPNGKYPYVGVKEIFKFLSIITGDLIGSKEAHRQ